MALYYELPVYRDTYKLTLKVFEATQNFPKEYKYSLGQDMKRDTLQLVRSIYRANIPNDKGNHKAIQLDKLISESNLRTTALGKEVPVDD
jgi:hypothetical protein